MNNLMIIQIVDTIWSQNNDVIRLLIRIIEHTHVHKLSEQINKPKMPQKFRNGWTLSQNGKERVGVYWTAHAGCWLAAVCVSFTTEKTGGLESKETQE